MHTPLFRAKGLRKKFLGIAATDNVSLEVFPREIHALIGPNGAGKSTLVNLISGVLAPDAGSIELDGRRLDKLTASARVGAGLSRCFQVSSLFRELSVLENIQLALQAISRSPLSAFNGRGDLAPGARARAEELASAVGLERQLKVLAGALPHGAQRQLDVALAMASRPKLLLLDEPMAGMGPDESERMGNLIERIGTEIAILLIEHDMEAVFRLADRISVLVSGRLLATGTPDAIRTDKDVRAVYLGTEERAA